MVWEPEIEKVDGEVHRMYLAMAYRLAADNSTDPNTWTGAVIVSPDYESILGVGFNHVMRGTDFTAELLADRDWKMKHTVHAEPTAIYDAARRGNAIEGAVMYMP